MRRFTTWLFKTGDWTKEDYVAIRVWTILVWTFFIGFLVGHYLT